MCCRKWLERLFLAMDSDGGDKNNDEEPTRAYFPWKFRPLATLKSKKEAPTSNRIEGTDADSKGHETGKEDSGEEDGMKVTVKQTLDGQE